MEKVGAIARRSHLRLAHDENDAKPREEAAAVRGAYVGRAFPCGVCGRDVGRNVWAHDECAEQQRQEALRRELADARASIPSDYAWATFDAREIGERVKPRKACLVTAKAWADGVRMLTLTGPSGAGKTSLACAMLRATIDSGARGVETSRFVRSWELAKARSEHALGRGEAPLVTLALRAHTLVIDELGEELRSSSRLVRGDTAIRDVLHERQAAGRRTIITTYLSRDEIAATYGAGIARRLDERGLVIELGGEA